AERGRDRRLPRRRSRGMSATETLPGLLAAQAERRPNGVAIRRKHHGIWRETTWAELAADVRRVALALDHSGVRPRARVLLLAENEPAWLVADLAIQAVGAVSVAVFPALDAEELASIVAQADARVAFCGDQEHVDKLFAAGDAVAFEQVVV